MNSDKWVVFIKVNIKPMRQICQSNLIINEVVYILSCIPCVIYSLHLFWKKTLILSYTYNDLNAENW